MAQTEIASKNKSKHLCVLWIKNMFYEKLHYPENAFNFLHRLSEY